jgi:ketosteroid isomerase-like protein
MVFRTGSMAIALLLSSACVALAQTPEEAVTSTIRALYAALDGGDAEAAGQVIADPFLFQQDAFDEPEGREGFLNSVRNGAPRPKLTLGDYKPAVSGDAAWAVIPLEVAGDLPIGVLRVRAVVLAVHAGESWKVASLTHLWEPAPYSDLLKGVREAAGPEGMDCGSFLDKLAEGLIAGEPSALAALCHPTGVLAGPWGPDGAMAIVAPSALSAAGAGHGTRALRPASSSDRVFESGIGAALVATDLLVTDADVPGQRCRGIVVLGWGAGEGGASVQWRVFAGIVAPLAAK